MKTLGEVDKTWGRSVHVSVASAEIQISITITHTKNWSLVLDEYLLHSSSVFFKPCMCETVHVFCSIYCGTWFQQACLPYTIIPLIYRMVGTQQNRMLFFSIPNYQQSYFLAFDSYCCMLISYCVFCTYHQKHLVVTVSVKCCVLIWPMGLLEC